MPFRSTEFNKDAQIRNVEGEFRTDIDPLAGKAVDPPKAKFIAVEKYGGIEKFKPSTEGGESKPGSRATRRRINKFREDKLKKYFRPVHLTKEQEDKVKKDIKDKIADWKQSRGDLSQRLIRWNNLVEGIREPSDFPWEGAANLHIPLIEIQMNLIHSAIRQTMLKNDSLWVGEYFGVNEEMLTQMLEIENFLNFKSRTDLSLASVLSEISWSALRDGTAVAQVSWVDERERVPRLVTYKTIQDFQDVFPNAQDSRISQDQYLKILETLESGNPVDIQEEHEKIVYRGPLVDLVELNDFVMSPMTATETRFASLVGKRFPIPLSAVFSNERQGWYTQGSADRVKAGSKQSNFDHDSYRTDRNQIEGINDSNKTKDVILYDGIHRFDLDGDDINEKYVFTYDEASDTLLAYWDYPYDHYRDCFVPVRFKKRPKRFLGRSLPEQLEDINEEIDTQHNQRVNSRTISSVPTFKGKSNLKNELDLTQRDQRWKPGKIYWLTRPEDFNQFDIRETDFSQSEREEQNLFQVADIITGATQLRSGRETRADPRAPALKVQTLLQQSNIRLDDNMEEMAGDSGRNEGFNAIGFQCLELYRQFGDEEDFKFLNTIEPREINVETGIMGPGNVQQNFLNPDEIESEKIKIMMSKTSVSQNPDAQFQKEFLIYQILANEPLVGGQEEARMQMVSDLLASARKEKLRRLLVARLKKRTPDMAQTEQNNLLQNVLSSLPRNNQNGNQGSGQEAV